jgi:hypothetical protein
LAREAGEVVVVVVVGGTEAEGVVAVVGAYDGRGIIKNTTPRMTSITMMINITI